MYLKLLYTAFLVYTSSQINLAQKIDDCDMCQERKLCSNAEHQSLSITVNHDTGLGDSFGVLNTSHPDTFIILDSCDKNAMRVTTFDKRQLDELTKIVSENANEKVKLAIVIEFPSGFDDCIEIKTIKERAKEIIKNMKKEQNNTLQIDVLASDADTDKQGLRSLGNNRYNLYPNCNDTETPLFVYENRKEVQDAINKIVQQMPEFQINSAQKLDNCNMCQERGLCPNEQTDFEDQSLSIIVNHDTGLGESFGVLNTSHPDTFIILNSCDKKAMRVTTFDKKQLDELAKTVSEIANKKIEFPGGFDDCIEIKTIKERAKKIIRNIKKEQNDVLQIDVSGLDADTDKQGLRSLGNNRYNLYPNCNDTETPLFVYENRKEAQDAINKIVQKLSGIQIRLGAGSCVTYNYIGRKIKKLYSEYYPLKKSEIDAVALPANVRFLVESTRGIMKYASEYLETSDCYPIRTVTMSDASKINGKLEEWTSKVEELLKAIIKTK